MREHVFRVRAVFFQNKIKKNQMEEMEGVQGPPGASNVFNYANVAAGYEDEEDTGSDENLNNESGVISMGKSDGEAEGEEEGDAAAAAVEDENERVLPDDTTEVTEGADVAAAVDAAVSAAQDVDDDDGGDDDDANGGDTAAADTSSSSSSSSSGVGGDGSGGGGGSSLIQKPKKKKWTTEDWAERGRALNLPPCCAFVYGVCMESYKTYGGINPTGKEGSMDGSATVGTAHKIVSAISKLGMTGPEKTFMDVGGSLGCFGAHVAMHDGTKVAFVVLVLVTLIFLTSRSFTRSS